MPASCSSLLASSCKYRPNSGERWAGEQNSQSLNRFRSPANSGQIQVNTVEDGGNSHSSIHRLLVVRDPDTVHGSEALCCSLFTQSDNSVPWSDLAVQNGNQRRQPEAAKMQNNAIERAALLSFFYANNDDTWVIGKNRHFGPGPVLLSSKP